MPAACVGASADAASRQGETRLGAKALRDARDAAERAAGTAPAPPRSASGFVQTDQVHVSKPVTGKRPYGAVATAATAVASNRDGRLGPRAADGAALRPAPKFARFVDYDMSAMTDTKGGFLAADDDPHGAPAPPADAQRPRDMTVQDWERLQLLRSLKRQKAGPFEPAISVLADEEAWKRCRECRSLEIDFVWDEVFGVCVCHKCKDRYPEKYSLLTKTECKEDYLLTDRACPMSMSSAAWPPPPC